jgi:hypothetical protein
MSKMVTLNKLCALGHLFNDIFSFLYHISKIWLPISETPCIFSSPQYFQTTPEIRLHKLLYDASFFVTEGSHFSPKLIIPEILGNQIYMSDTQVGEQNWHMSKETQPKSSLLCLDLTVSFTQCIRRLQYAAHYTVHSLTHQLSAQLHQLLPILYLIFSIPYIINPFIKISQQTQLTVTFFSKMFHESRT